MVTGTSVSTDTTKGSTRKWASASPPVTPLRRSATRVAARRRRCISRFASQDAPSTQNRGSRAPRLKPKGTRNANCINVLRAFFSDGPTDVLRKLHGALRAAGPIAAAARGIDQPVRKYRQAAVEQRPQHESGSVRAGAAGDRATRRPSRKERRGRRAALLLARRRTGLSILAA